MSCKETLESSTSSGDTPQVSDEELKIRDILIEKMEEHEARTQQLRGTKKQTTSMPQDFKKPLLFEAENYDIKMMHDANNDFSLNDTTPANQEAEIWNDDNLEVTSTGSEPTTENYHQLVPNTAAASDTAEGYCFSRLTPERGVASPVARMVGDRDDIFCQSIFHGDPECREDREEVEGAVSALESRKTSDNRELKHASFTAHGRPPSPEFDIELPEPKASLPGNITAEYSLISEADDCLREKSEVEVCNTNFADEDGGFLSVLSEAAVYHASLKPFVRDDSVKLTENVAMCSECSQDASHCGYGSVCKEHDSTEMHLEPLPLCEASGEFREERRGQKECPEGDLGKMGTDDDSESSPYIVRESCLLDSSLGSHMESWGREMDASSDLNDSDRRKIEDMKQLESCPNGEEFHDSLEEIELLLKFGMDYMMSTDDEQRGMLSAPLEPQCDMSEFEDFGDAVDQIESRRHLADGTETSCEDRSAVAVETCVSSVSDQNSVPRSHHGKTASLSEAGENWFVKPQTTSVRKPHSKLQAVESPTVKGNKTLGKPVLQKLLPPRSAKKSPLKPCRRPVNYREIVSPVGVYIHNTPSPSLVTIVKPKLLHTATPKGTVVGRGATAVAVSAVENTPLKVGTTCTRLTVRISCSLPRLWLLSP
jgi:hypothetical protein